MLKGERGFFVFILLCLCFGSTVWMVMRPQYPSLPTNEYRKAEETAYSPGNPRCRPSRLNGLPKGEAADERYRCETQAQKHSLQGDDLVQQTRSADAAVAAVELSFRQLLLELAGAIFGVMTLLAAAYAAFYARRAAEANHLANSIAEARNLADLRPYIGVTKVGITGLEIGPDHGWQNDPGQNRVRIDVKASFNNFGKSVALNVSCGLCIGTISSKPDDLTYFFANPKIIYPGSTIHIDLWMSTDYASVFDEVYDGCMLYLFVRYEMPGHTQVFNVLDFWRVGGSMYKGSLQPLNRAGHAAFGEYAAVADYQHTRVDHPLKIEG